MVVVMVVYPTVFRNFVKTVKICATVIVVAVVMVVAIITVVVAVRVAVLVVVVSIVVSVSVSVSLCDDVEAVAFAVSWRLDERKKIHAQLYQLAFLV